MNILISYAFIRRSKALFNYALAISKHCNVLIDSGAFSAFKSGEVITLKEYNNFCKKYGKNFTGYIQLDVIGDKVQTEINYQKSLDEGLTPIPVLQVDEDVEKSIKLKETTDYICVSGPAVRGISKDWVSERIRQVYDLTGLKMHALGLGPTDDIGDIPLYSCDSSGYTIPGMNYLISLFNGKNSLLHELDDMKSLVFASKCETKALKNGNNSLSYFSGFYSYLKYQHYIKESFDKNYYFAIANSDNLRRLAYICSTSTVDKPDYMGYYHTFRNYRISNSKKHMMTAVLKYGSMFKYSNF
jgi:hypothetical protein